MVNQGQDERACRPVLRQHHHYNRSTRFSKNIPVPMVMILGWWRCTAAIFFVHRRKRQPQVAISGANADPEQEDVARRSGTETARHRKPDRRRKYRWLGNSLDTTINYNSAERFYVPSMESKENTKIFLKKQEKKKTIKLKWFKVWLSSHWGEDPLSLCLPWTALLFV